MPGQRSSVGLAVFAALAILAVLPSTDGLSLGQPPSERETRAPEVRCVLADGRAYRLVNEGTTSVPRWVLSLRMPGATRDRTAVVLRGGAPRMGDGRAALRYRSANGGIIVHLDSGASQDGGVLDVFVSYELEVNVDTTLQPEIDDLNTDGERPATCRVF